MLPLATCCLPMPTTVYILACGVTNSVGRTVEDTYPRVAWLINMDHSSLEDLQLGKIGLHVRGKFCRTVSLSAIPPKQSRLRPHGL